ncbi:MAG: lipopolysaccharide transport periplasmic protein LptA [Neisseriaceae bacterium]
MNIKMLSLLFCFGICSFKVQAKEADEDGPIQILANTVHVQQTTQSGELIGNVEIQQGNFQLQADQVLLQGLKSSLILHAIGAPVRLKQTAPTNPTSKAQKLQPMQGQANEVIYNNKTGDIDLKGSAYLKIKKNEINSGSIHYNTLSQHYQLTPGSSSKRNSILIYPQAL